MSLFECTDPEKEREYFAQASTMTETMRSIASPNLLPVDAARLALDEAWPYGCGLFNLDAPGRKCFAGLVRAFSEGGGARPHTDRCDWDMPGSADAQAVECQLACNLYLQKPQGGELELWDIHPSKDVYEALRLPDDYGLDRGRLPEPDVVINPKPGDLVCFNASKIHAVRASRGGIRTAQSWFIAFRGSRRPLALFS
jgi:predicted 2-oxoglutarate/Fe(II)-dependent dioxygenase YbiX